MTILRLILGDQLNLQHSWFRKKQDGVIYLMAEMKQEATYVTHHRAKLLAFFGAMRYFAGQLSKEGHRVRYYRIGDPDNPHDLEELLKQELTRHGAEKFEYLLPDEYRLDEQLKTICRGLALPCETFDTEHFLTTRTTLQTFFKGNDQFLMESFYRMMRKKYRILLDEHGKPLGGKWNFDKSNRKQWKGNPPVPSFPQISNNLRDIDQEITAAGIPALGSANSENFNWPLNRSEALRVLEHFCSNLLPHFGDYQDAMHTGDAFLFHSRLSFALNTKILHPAEVINKVLSAFHKDPENIHISQAEGFVRQILGWREYMRGIYWMTMPGYRSTNFFGNQNPLPEFYWTANTKMNCLKHCITNSLDNGYAHHIQRLMITGNFALLNQTHPDAVDLWYLGIYIDAIEWVEITNTRGMSQYADGGLLATKPYIASANYIHKMSNYCGACTYDHKKRTGDHACPFNALYWNFLFEKAHLLRSNPRMGMMYRLLDIIDSNELEEIRKRSRKVMENPDLF